MTVPEVPRSNPPPGPLPYQAPGDPADIQLAKNKGSRLALPTAAGWAKEQWDAPRPRTTAGGTILGMQAAFPEASQLSMSPGLADPRTGAPDPPDRSPDLLGAPAQALVLVDGAARQTDRPTGALFRAEAPTKQTDRPTGAHRAAAVAARAADARAAQEAAHARLHACSTNQVLVWQPCIGSSFQ
jgi:hypothetical protein